MITFQTLALMAVGFALGVAYLKLLAYRANTEYQDDPESPPRQRTPLNDLQRTVYEPTDAPRPVASPATPTPVKRRPGRPRKTPVDPERYIGGGTRQTRTYAAPLPGVKSRKRRDVH